MTKVEYDELLVGRDIDDNGGKDGIEVGRLTEAVGLLIKNFVVRGWYPWADEVVLC